jgi:hypothetical protein
MKLPGKLLKIGRNKFQETNVTMYCMRSQGKTNSTAFKLQNESYCTEHTLHASNWSAPSEKREHRTQPK